MPFYHTPADCRFCNMMLDARNPQENTYTYIGSRYLPTHGGLYRKISIYRLFGNEREFINGRCRTLSGHFLANCINIFHKTEVLTVILMCLMGQNLNWFKIYDTKCTLRLRKILAKSKIDHQNLHLINGHFWPFLGQLYVNIAQNWSSDGHFEVLNKYESWLVLNSFDTKIKNAKNTNAFFLQNHKKTEMEIFAFCHIFWINQGLDLLTSQNDRLNFSFVKYSHIVFKKMARNDRKMAIYHSLSFPNSHSIVTNQHI